MKESQRVGSILKESIGISSLSSAMTQKRIRANL